MTDMDELDRSIIAQLAQDARMSVAVLARRLKVARSTVQARLERLETTGAIAGYTLRLGEAARVNRIRATCLLTIDPPQKGKDRPAGLESMVSWRSDVGEVVSHERLLGVDVPEGEHTVTLRFLPRSALGGAAVILAADLATRLILPERDLKLGVLTALIGAPFFIHMILTLRKQSQ